MRIRFTFNVIRISNIVAFWLAGPGLLFAADFPQWKHLSSASGDLPIPNGGKEQTACLALDVDKDGLNDIVIAERSQAPSIVWLKRQADGWAKYPVETGKTPVAAGGTACDIDGDGDLDLVFGTPASGSEIWWWENPHPKYDTATPWKRRLIAETGKGMHHDQLAGDFLGEGRPQVVSWFQGGNALLLYRIPADPRQDSPWTSVTVADGIKGGEGLAAGDMDGDGKLDIVGAGRWFKHEGGTRFAAHVIDAAQTGSRVAVGDLKKGGRPEVVMVSGDGVGPLKWYECAGDPRQTESWTAHDLLGADANHAHSLQTADLNGDDNLDIFCAEMAQWSVKAAKPDNPNAKAWIFYGDGKGNFAKTELASGFEFHEAKVADLDGDGRPDIVSKPFVRGSPRVDVWLNLGVSHKEIQRTN